MITCSSSTALAILNPLTVPTPFLRASLASHVSLVVPFVANAATASVLTLQTFRFSLFISSDLRCVYNSPSSSYNHVALRTKNATVALDFTTARQNYSILSVDNAALREDSKHDARARRVHNR